MLPSLLILGMGMGCVFAPAFQSATYGVAPSDAGIASAMVNVGQQVGGSIGTALLSSIFASAVSAYVADKARRARWRRPPACTATAWRSGCRRGSSPPAR